MDGSRSLGDDAHRAALGSEEFLILVDSKGMAHGGVEVTNFDRAFGGSHAVFVRGTDEGTSLDTCPLYTSDAADE